MATGPNQRAYEKPVRETRLTRGHDPLPKSAGKSVAPASMKSGARGRPFQPGHDPRRGRGPAKGAPNAGRPPDAIRAELRRYIGSPKVMKSSPAV